MSTQNTPVAFVVADEDAEREHHPFSPSGLQPREVCPGFKSKAGDSAASIRGTKCHHAVEKRSIEGLETDEEIEAVEACIDYIKEVEEQIPGESLQELYLPVDDEKIIYKGKPYDGTTAGYLDFARVSEDKTFACIVDYKFVRWDITPSEKNLQGISYALGLVKMIPTLKRVHVVFLKPYIRDLSEHTFTVDELKTRQYLRVVTTVERARRLDEEFERGCPTLSDLVPSDGLCMFCDRKSKCGALKNYCLEPSSVYPELRAPKMLTGTELSVSKNPDDIAAALDYITLATGWLSSVKDDIKSLISSDSLPTPTGFRPSISAKSSIVDNVGFAKLVDEILGEGAHRDYMGFSLTPIEAAIAARAARGKKKEAKELFRTRALSEGFLQEGEPFLVLRRINDADASE